MTEPASSPLATFQQHLKQGRLAYQFSAAAGRPVFYPRVVCPHTGEDRLEWRISAGLGTVYSTTAVHGREGAMHNVALIDMDEGFRLMSRVDGVAPDAVKIGQRVSFAGCDTDDGEPFPIFKPEGSA